MAVPTLPKIRSPKSMKYRAERPPSFLLNNIERYFVKKTHGKSRTIAPKIMKYIEKNEIPIPNGATPTFTNKLQNNKQWAGNNNINTNTSNTTCTRPLNSLLAAKGGEEKRRQRVGHFSRTSARPSTELRWSPLTPLTEHLPSSGASPKISHDPWLRYTVYMCAECTKLNDPRGSTPNTYIYIHFFLCCP